MAVRFYSTLPLEVPQILRVVKTHSPAQQRLRVEAFAAAAMRDPRANAISRNFLDARIRTESDPKTIAQLKTRVGEVKALSDP